MGSRPERGPIFNFWGDNHKKLKIFKKFGFFAFGDLFGTPTVHFHNFYQIYILPLWLINKNPNRDQIRGFSWNLENQLYCLHFEVQKIFLHASLNVPRGGIPQGGLNPPNSEKVYIKSVVAQWRPHLNGHGSFIWRPSPFISLPVNSHILGL